VNNEKVEFQKTECLANTYKSVWYFQRHGQELGTSSFCFVFDFIYGSFWVVRASTADVAKKISF